jgi:hypothetical protein
MVTGFRAATQQARAAVGVSIALFRSFLGRRGKLEKLQGDLKFPSLVAHWCCCCCEVKDTHQQVQLKTCQLNKAFFCRFLKKRERDRKGRGNKFKQDVHS